MDTINPNNADVHKSFNLVYYLYKERTHSKGLLYELSIDERLPEFLVFDEQRVKQVIQNLISNASKFTEKGRVLITVFVYLVQRVNQRML